MNNLQLTATTFFGLESVLAAELLDLGARNIKIGNRAVHFEGDLGFMYKANYNLHTALRILWQIGHFKNIYKPDNLYRAISQINWDEYIDSHQSFRIDVTGQTKFFKNTRFIALKAKDAIADFFRAKYGKRPDVSLKSPDLHIILHFFDQKMTVMLDSSGSSLHKRGYRSLTNLAPLNEVLAAGMVALSGWNGQTGMLDPMCGSGTILIEATMWALKIPAGINRKDFGFKHWKNYDSELFKLIQKSSFKRIIELPAGTKISGYDKAPSAIKKAVQNIENAGLDEFINVKQADFFSTMRPSYPVTLIFNPPYNERLSIDTRNFYNQIGSTLKHRYTNTTAWLLTGNLQALKYIGLRSAKKIKLFNGKIESRLVRYDLYEGSKK